MNNSIINNPLQDVEKIVSLLSLEIDELKYDANMTLASKNTPCLLDEADIIGRIKKNSDKP